MGNVVKGPWRRHAQRSAGSMSRTRLDAEIPVSASIRAASAKDGPRLPPRIKERCDSEQPTALANSARVPARSSIASASLINPSMTRTLPAAKLGSQDKLCCREIAKQVRGAHPMSMTTGVSADVPRLYIGEWIEVLELQPRAIATQAGVSEPYLNQLIHRKKTNPSPKILARIAGAMGLTFADLWKPPPSKNILKTIQGMSDEQIARLRDRKVAS